MSGFANPQSLNRFAYVANNPLRYTDPTGHMMSAYTDGGGGSYTTSPITDYCSTHPSVCSGGSGGSDDGGDNGDGGGGSTTPSSTPTPSMTPVPPPTASPIGLAPTATPFPSYTSGYTSTTVTNSLGEEIPPVYGGWNLNYNPTWLAEPYGFSLEPEYADGSPVNEPITILKIPAINEPPQYEILVNTTTTTTTVTHDSTGQIMQVNVAVESSSAPMTPYWQLPEQEFNFHSSWQ